ncbi:hypothetical protein LJC58_00250 [Lachnospiraceae bacterium OttesenSCG-928-D06]|nr:hypothetical protein [Lachnospiraceae bacterium OttesenSCG-928-D06]
MDVKEGQQGKGKGEVFLEALKGKKVPILTLDHKWYKIFKSMPRDEKLSEMETKLNELLKRQGKLNTESKDIRKLKKKLMDEIVPLVDSLETYQSSETEKKIEENKRLIEECNDKLDDYKLELLELPVQISEINFSLMQSTMHYCYETMQANTEDIVEITKWVADIRVELKKNLIRKQEKEQQNHDIYSYMHDIFGADVIDIFDMKYNPEEQYQKKLVDINKKQEEKK